MDTRNARRLVAVALVSVAAGIAAACQRDAADLATLPIHLDKALGDDLRLAGLQITTLPDRRSWIVTLSSTVRHERNPRQPLWVHAYPQERSDYVTLDPAGTFTSANVGHVVKDAFLLKSAGAFNLYVGVTGADGSLGPALGLGWVGVGDPDTPEYHVAYRFLQEADDTRAAAMLAQTQRVYPDAKLP